MSISPQRPFGYLRSAAECDRRANNRQVVQRNTKSKKETSQAEEALEESGIAGIYVYTYPQYYRHPIVSGADDTDASIYLKIGMSEKDTFKRVMQQKTGMPERPMILQIWEVEYDSDLREIEKKIHEHLRKAGHGDHSNEGREWFLTNEQFVASTASLIGLKLHYERNPETDN
ncbi:MAG: GIY-YIG nuclease family protein [Gemmatimonadetes bacterium]|nr:GIY-YIG nuclease family protein [Gemmatimonadota bacterium]